MRSPPRELTRTLIATPENTPITDVTSDDTGRRVANTGGNPRSSEMSLNQEVVMLTQRQLTSEFEVAEMNNLKGRQLRLGNETLNKNYPKKFIFVQQARALIEEMRANFTVEDQGCIRSIEMLEDQRNEYATGLKELGNRAEAILQKRNAAYIIVRRYKVSSTRLKSTWEVKTRTYQD